MDPALANVIEQHHPDAEIEALVLLEDPAGLVPPKTKEMARFDAVRSVRLAAGDIGDVWSDPRVVSIKAPRSIGSSPTPRSILDDSSHALADHDAIRPPRLAETGSGVVVGIVDQGFDFAHPDLRQRGDGSTRFLALWDQADPSGRPPSPFDYGTFHTAHEINRALRASDPYRALGHQPWSYTSNKRGAHGTKVLGAAVGNGAGGGPQGLAPEAQIVAVNLASRTRNRTEATFGDTVRLVEAVAFISRVAGSRPCVVNLSLGAHGGPHDGSSLVERALDSLASRSGRVVCNSTGNYFHNRTHAFRRLRSGERWELDWLIPKGDTTDNELEMWYPGADDLVVSVADPTGKVLGSARLGETADLVLDGHVVGRLHHRRFDPLNHDNMVDLFLFNSKERTPDGTWKFQVDGLAIRDGSCHVWSERDESRRQARFPAEQSDGSTTTGTICNGANVIAVGAYDGRLPDAGPAYFSSKGPTRTGLLKPDVIAPGVQIKMARSAVSGQRRAGLYQRDSGTSFAAPQATGTVACMLEAASGALNGPLARALIRSTALPYSGRGGDRSGAGLLNPTGAVVAARGMKRNRRRSTQDRRRSRGSPSRPVTR